MKAHIVCDMNSALDNGIFYTQVFSKWGIETWLITYKSLNPCFSNVIVGFLPIKLPVRFSCFQIYFLLKGITAQYFKASILQI